MVEVPAVELLGYMDAHFTEEETEMEKERARTFLSFLVNTYSQQGSAEDTEFQRNKKAFIESIKPRQDPEPQQLNGPAKIYDWDEELLKRLKAQQERG